jgi:hypothetical protein
MTPSSPSPRRRPTLRVGDTFSPGHDWWGNRPTFTVVQRTADDLLVLYRESTGVRDERNRWYIIGGGRRGLRRLEDD